jgi:hypothetical protein
MEMSYRDIHDKKKSQLRIWSHRHDMITSLRDIMIIARQLIAGMKAIGKQPRPVGTVETYHPIYIDYPIHGIKYLYRNVPLIYAITNE